MIGIARLTHNAGEKGVVVNTINHFMWGYQPHFRIGFSSIAKQALGLLDARLEPEVFLVGILDPSLSNEQNHPACVEPESDHWVASEYFNGALSRLPEFYARYPHLQLYHSHQSVEQDTRLQGSVSMLRDSIERLIKEHPGRPDGKTFRASLPVLVNNYWVSVVIGLQDPVVLEYGSLLRKTIWVHERRNFSVPRSLIESVVFQLFEEASSLLQKPNPGRDLCRGIRSAEEIVRTAGSNFASGAVLRLETRKVIHEPVQVGSQSFFQACSSIAGLRYEGDPGSGRILLAKRNHRHLRKILEFSKPQSFSQYRSVRKLLELCRKDLLLQTDSSSVLGLVTDETAKLTNEREDLFEVVIKGHHLWDLVYQGRILMRVRYGIPELPRRSFEEERVVSNLQRLFRSDSKLDSAKIVELVKMAEEERHGTLLVVTPRAAEECSRLSSQGTPIEPCTLTPKLLSNLTGIDGAVIVDVDGTAHGIGMILDGLATEEGDSGRGARYNSSIRYVASQARCLAIVISEDGGIDFIPDLRPAISRALIDQALEQLLMQERLEFVSRKVIRGCGGFLDKHRFYLLPQDCQKLNRLMPLLEDRLAIQEDSDIRFVHSEFRPHKEFDASLYYEP